MACSGGGGVAAEYVGTLLGLAPALPCGRVGERFHKRRFKSRAPPCRVTRRKKERERERELYTESHVRLRKGHSKVAKCGRFT